ncbi:C-x8-C-x5-C-x3-H type zinc finger protein [Aspergillus sclerotiicarbonarius CBS 121057]|uniref:C-x8-C-x5-C-x3-H type zinc finger protein n=1 Tax=Aspergillus sclerotiicarbonarius (strain CBS 121057 / IBT 28362) TaxID=1448318 RepID=A0A319FL95_ASPSB|nr:C-x8-C-x5-C-x3-H type zinc finger protein [Aspergillus sclerotiicarbonarius CBS 121057]
MLGDAEIHALDGSLGSIIQQNHQHHTDLQNLLDKFRQLLDSYNNLKSDYEEEKEAREKYKRMARGQERNPFVLVLIDGDGYLFKEHLVKAGSEGGITAARLLNDSIRELIHDRLGSQADQCRVMVRIYANVLGLSKSLARSGFVGHEARSLAPFAASFTRAQDLFDFVDAGDKKEGADYKIREMFRLFADNNQCKHIFFAGCHDSGYSNLLTPYRGRTDRITLLKGAGFHSEYERLDLPVRELPAVFMSTPLGGNGSMMPNHTASVSNGSRPICKHFQKGICRYGNACIKVHIPQGQQISKSDDHPSSPPGRESPTPTRNQEYYASNLVPNINPVWHDCIPTNSAGDRIDTYCPMPSHDAWDTYTRRAKIHKPCNKYHLGGDCGNMGCEYDHTRLDPSSLHVMKYILRQHPCQTGPSCRSLKCYLGHICQKDGCRGTKPCKFNRYAHTLDLHIAGYIPPLERRDTGPSPPSESSGEAYSADSNDDVPSMLKTYVF